MLHIVATLAFSLVTLSVGWMLFDMIAGNWADVRRALLRHDRVPFLPAPRQARARRVIRVAPGSRIAARAAA